MTTRTRFFLLMVILVFAPCSVSADETVIQGLSMGTTYTISITQDLEPREKKKLAQKIQMLLEDFSQEFSTYDTTSKISIFNRTKSTKPFPVSARFARLTTLAAEIAKKTKGAFDPTIEPVAALWGFGVNKSRGTAPGQTEIDHALSTVGITKLAVIQRPPSLRKLNPQLQLDLSAMAKGFGVDEVSRLLNREGFRNYMVEIGGEIHARGRNSKGDVWRIGIAVPDRTTNKLEAIVKLSNTSIATSGDYQKYVEIDGDRVAHIIDPRNGKPISHKLASASVLHDDCAIADAFATALMVVGHREAKEMAEKLELPVLLIVREAGGFVTWTSKQWPQKK
ncbi:MAG: FAD:protein FMN transferase [Hyphomicrobiaceae bacterium]